MTRPTCLTTVSPMLRPGRRIMICLLLALGLRRLALGLLLGTSIVLPLRSLCVGSASQ